MRRALVVALSFAALAHAKDPMIAQAMEMLLRDDENSRFAEKILKAIPDRAAVLAEAERALADDKPGVGGKLRTLILLAEFGREEIVAVGLASSSVTTRRAAVVLNPREEATRATLLAWIEEDPPRDRALLVRACSLAAMPEALPKLREVLHAADTPPQVFARALGALATHPSPDLADVVKSRLSDPSEDPARVTACMDVVADLPGVDADALLLPWLVRRDAGALRARAALRISDRETLRKVILDPEETDAILDRSCLYRLSRLLDDDAFLELLRNPRVARHTYYAVRVDVATSLACLEGTGKEDLLLLLDYLVDEDPRDKLHLVRSEAWITLWTLTGKLRGTGKDLGQPPPRSGDREHRCSRMRVGVSLAQRRELERLAKDLDHMREVRQAYATAK